MEGNLGARMCHFHESKFGKDGHFVREDSARERRRNWSAIVKVSDGARATADQGLTQQEGARSEYIPPRGKGIRDARWPKELALGAGMWSRKLVHTIW